jgi:hypothetical protein
VHPDMYMSLGAGRSNTDAPHIPRVGD